MTPEEEQEIKNEIKDVMERMKPLIPFIIIGMISKEYIKKMDEIVKRIEKLESKGDAP